MDIINKIKESENNRKLVIKKIQENFKNPHIDEKTRAFTKFLWFRIEAISSDFYRLFEKFKNNKKKNQEILDDYFNYTILLLEFFTESTHDLNNSSENYEYAKRGDFIGARIEEIEKRFCDILGSDSEIFKVLNLKSF